MLGFQKKLCVTSTRELSWFPNIHDGVLTPHLSDERCEEPLWISMEDPGDCSFSELDIKDKAVAVLCYDSTL